MAARIEGAWHRNLRAYPEYKESGVEWLGEIPEHWAVNRLRTTVTGCQNGVWGEEADGVHDLLCVRVADFDRGRFRVRMDEPTERIVVYLDAATQETDRLIGKILRAIDHLRDFRTALISAAVTGKINVREAASR